MEPGLEATGTELCLSLPQALAFGADCVLLGRPICHGLAMGGQEGVEKVLETLHEELTLDMALAGVPCALRNTCQGRLGRILWVLPWSHSVAVAGHGFVHLTCLHAALCRFGHRLCQHVPQLSSLPLCCCVPSDRGIPWQCTHCTHVAQQVHCIAHGRAGLGWCMPTAASLHCLNLMCASCAGRPTLKHITRDLVLAPGDVPIG